MKRLPPCLFSARDARSATRGARVLSALHPAAYRLPPGARRGVLLLVVLCMLALFALIGITFVLVTSQSRRTARADNRAQQRLMTSSANGSADVEAVFGQFVRDSTNSQSSIRYHSLLNDIYGIDGAKGTFSSAASPNPPPPPMPWSPSTQFIDFKVDVALAGQLTNLPGTTFPNLFQVQTPGYFNGCVLTMLEGPAANLSTRIVGWGYNPAGSGTYTVRAMAFDDVVLANAIATGTIANGSTGPITLGSGVATTGNNQTGYPINTGDLVMANQDSMGMWSLTPVYGKFLINGRAFNGTGVGLQPNITFAKLAGNMAIGGPGLVSYTLPNGTSVSVTATNQTGIALNAGAVAMATQDPTTSAWSLVPTMLSASKTFTPTTGPSVQIPYALLPNPRYFPGGDPNYPIFGGIGGMDEDYEAADPQNMFLAYLSPVDPTNPTAVPPILPSFHRPDLIAYLSTQYPTVWSDSNVGLALQRQASLRPIGGSSNTDHPNFTGGNPSFNAVTGPWDVDNDKDGVADSIWVDVGLPVQTSTTGRRYKPLAAILCVDLDGRLNVNAHGNVAQLDTSYNTFAATGGTPIMPSAGLPPATIADYVLAIGGTAVPVQLPRGSGYGPAEINLGLAPGIFWNPATDYSNFFNGIIQGTTTYEGRYGKYGTAPPRPGTAPAIFPGADDKLDFIKRFDFPAGGYNYYGGVLSDYGSPSDLWGRSVVAIDYAGQPITSFLNSPPLNQPNPNLLGGAAPETPNDPYTFDLARNRPRSGGVPPTSGDNAFSAGELERILRKYDTADASSLPDRLRALLDPLGVNMNDLARLVTTDAYDLPSPNCLPTKDTAALLSFLNGVVNVSPTSNTAIVDLLAARMLKGLIDYRAANMIATPVTAGDLQLIYTQIASQRMLPPELIAGLKFDLNRPFGNGQDDDGNGVVDEPTPSEFVGGGKNEVPSNWTAAFAAAAPLGFDLNNDGTVDPDPTHTRVDPDPTHPLASDLYARQQYAKHLYILMMLLVDQRDPTTAVPPYLAYIWGQDSGAPLDPATQKELTARRIAQWAVNVVDFRDADSIMTPFEYDVDPFNADGWSVDGVIGTADDTLPDRRLVWGCEYPELLLTETLAFHDRRVDDTSGDSTGHKRNDMTPDPTLDQVRVPQGSLFLELYCPRPLTINPTQKNLPRELYNAAGQLDLGLMAPPTGVVPYPVWRVAIVGSTYAGAAKDANNINARVTNHPDLANFDPVLATGTTTEPFHYSVFDIANPQAAAQIERIIWFSGQDPSSNPESNKIYYNNYNGASSATLLNPGQYAIVGPRPTTYVGKGAAQRFDLDTGASTFTYTPANANTAANPPLPAAVLPIVCSSSTPPTGWTSKVGLSISEPLFAPGPPLTAYYPFPSGTSPDPPGLNAAPVKDTYSAPIDKPQDSAGGLTPAAPLVTDGILASGPHLNYKTALLQRLANPLLPFDPTSNPYITVDWQPIDLTVFNGEAKQQTMPVGYDPDDPLFQTAPGLIIAGSHERGSPTPNSVDLWNSYPSLPTTTPSPVGSTAAFDYNLINSLGYLNRAIGTPYTPPAGPLSGYAGVPSPLGATFPWLAWNNRPFTSSTELLLVPATSAEQLLRQFSPTALGAASPYDAVNAAPAGFQSPYRHLMNFFLTSDGSVAKAPYFYRLLDYVQVPSRFVGTETWLSPLKFNTALPDAATERSLASYYHPPFNKVSNYRDPGRVNINTMAGYYPVATPQTVSPVWTGVLNNAPGPTWAQIVTSRRGYGTVDSQALLVNPVTATNPGSPTVFANPFRTAGGAAYALPGTPPLPSEISVTLLRPDPSSVTQPLFGFPAVGAPMGTVVSYNDPDRNPYFRYQTLERLGNLVTTHSNVYAIWITVGYFEVTPAPVSPIYPDGYQLGQELGSDTGTTTRHRGFYIYDRSIPVGFEPGRDHNVENGVLLKRLID